MTRWLIVIWNHGAGIVVLYYRCVVIMNNLIVNMGLDMVTTWTTTWNTCRWPIIDHSNDTGWDAGSQWSSVWHNFVLFGRSEMI